MVIPLMAGFSFAGESGYEGYVQGSDHSVGSDGKSQGL